MLEELLLQHPSVEAAGINRQGWEKLQLLDFCFGISCFGIIVFEMLELGVTVAPSSPWPYFSEY